MKRKINSVILMSLNTEHVFFNRPRCGGHRASLKLFMKTNFTPHQLLWAASHDWFISGDEFSIVCRNDWVKGGKVERDPIIHTNFNKLRNWAGY